MKITPHYLALNREMHARGTYGISGSKWARAVLKLADGLGTRDILDYGCGQRTLERALGFPIRNYDPCIPGLDAEPGPADLVVCTDVLEHIELECLDEVLDDLKRVTRKVGFFVIADRPAKKFLADGRNAHLIQQGVDWWRERIEPRFAVHQVGTQPGEHFFVVKKMAPGTHRGSAPDTVFESE